MSHRFLEEKDIDLNKWNDLILNSKTSSFFQTPQCYKFYKSLSFMEAFVYAVEEESKLVGLIVGYIQKDGGKLKQFFSRRAIIIGGPLLADDISDGVLTELLQCARAILSKKVIYIETRNFNDYSQHKKIFSECGFDYLPHLNFKVDTTSIDVVNSNLGKGRKRDIRTSLRDGATVINNPTLKEVFSYYNILQDLYITKVKTPLFPFEFFEKLFQLDGARFILVELNGEIIGGTVCVILENECMYEWFACGKDGIYKNIYPSTLATYSGIEYSANNGCKIFDMMGAGKPNEGYGVRDFKAKFGGEMVEFGRFLCVANKFLYNIGKLAVRFLKR